jgi:hypothetical protein
MLTKVDPAAGGVHAAMTGSLHPKPLAILPLLAPHSAAAAFCEGILQHGTAWEILRLDELAAAGIGMSLEQAVERMRTVLSLTDVTKFPLPKDPKAVIFVAATVSQFSFCYRSAYAKTVIFSVGSAMPSSHILLTFWIM